MQVHIIIYIRTPACARWYAYTSINNIIENLKSETRKTLHPININIWHTDSYRQNSKKPPFTTLHLPSPQSKNRIYPKNLL